MLWLIFIFPKFQAYCCTDFCQKPSAKIQTRNGNGRDAENKLHVRDVLEKLLVIGRGMVLLLLDIHNAADGH